MSVHDYSFPGDCLNQKYSLEMLMQQKNKKSEILWKQGAALFAHLAGASQCTEKTAEWGHKRIRQEETRLWLFSAVRRYLKQDRNPRFPVPAPKTYFYLIKDLVKRSYPSPVEWFNHKLLLPYTRHQVKKKKGGGG